MSGKHRIQWVCRSGALILAGLLVLPGCQSGSPAVGPALLNNVQEAKSVIEQSTLAIVPLRPDSLNLFESYSPQAEARWAKGWLGKIDMTGVALDSPQTCTLISPRHVLMAQHNQRSIGDTVVFHDKSGKPVIRVLEDKAVLPGGLNPDIAVGRLNQDAPVTYYRVLPPRVDYQAHLIGALAVITDKDRNLLMRRIAWIGNRHVRFAKATEFPDACADPLIVGDSGNPGFIIIKGVPLLLQTHTFGGLGQGPFVSDPDNYDGINDLMKRLGGGYQLTPIVIGSGSDAESATASTSW